MFSSKILTQDQTSITKDSKWTPLKHSNITFKNRISLKYRLIDVFHNFFFQISNLWVFDMRC